MKRLSLSTALCLLSLLISMPHVKAQEIRSDSLRTLSMRAGPSSLRSYGGYLLDLDAMGLVPALTSRSLERPVLQMLPLRTVLERIRLKDRVTYSRQFYTQAFGGLLYAPGHFAWDSEVGTASFRLQDGGNLKLMGDYDARLRRLFTAPVNWNSGRRGFRGGFEYSSPGGGFSLRMHVDYGRQAWP